MTLAQSCPGAVAVNAAILIGWKICPDLQECLLLFWEPFSPSYDHSFSDLLVLFRLCLSPPDIHCPSAWKAGVAATVLDVACDLGMATVKTKSSLSVFIMAGAFVLNFVFHVSVIYIILAAAVIGTVRLLIIRRFHREVSR